MSNVRVVGLSEGQAFEVREDGIENFLVDVHRETANDPANMENILAIAARHGFNLATG